MMLRLFVIAAICFMFSSICRAEETILERVSPDAVGMDGAKLDRIDRVVEDGLRRGNMPGCVVLVGHKGKVVFERAYGSRRLKPERVPMTLDTVFDMASLTKPVSTATSIMMLVEQGKIDLDAPASKYLPEFTSHGKDVITIKQLLTHQGGLIPDNSIKDYEDGRAVAFQKIHELDLRAEPGEKFMYTDVGFIVLGEIVERLSGLSQNEFTRKLIFEPLGMMETGYNPASPLKLRSAITQERNGKWMQGEVHDPRAYRMDGIAGHAGLFSTAQDLARYAQMIINGGALAGRRIMKAETIEKMGQPVQVSSGIRGLGWDKQTGYSSNKGDLLSDQAIGHGGFTGTAMWIDPEQDLFVIFLSNRVHPDGKGSVNSLAGRIATLAAAAIR